MTTLAPYIAVLLLASSSVSAVGVADVRGSGRDNPPRNTNMDRAAWVAALQPDAEINLSLARANQAEQNREKVAKRIFDYINHGVVEE